MTTTRILYRIKSKYFDDGQSTYKDSRYKPYICGEQIENLIGKCPKKIKVTLSDIRINRRQTKINLWNKGYCVYISLPYINTSDLFGKTSDILQKHAPELNKQYTLYLAIQEVK